MDWKEYSTQFIIPFNYCLLMKSRNFNYIGDDLMKDWESLSKRLKLSGVKFIIEPHVRFKGESGEQATMFFLDPCGNALEFKAFNRDELIFAK